MTEDNRSLAQQVKDLNRSTKTDKDTQLCYEMGDQAAYRGDPVTSCVFRNDRKRAAWLRGYADAENQKLYNTASPDGLKKICTIISTILKEAN